MSSIGDEIRDSRNWGNNGGSPVWFILKLLFSAWCAFMWYCGIGTLLYQCLWCAGGKFSNFLAGEFANLDKWFPNTPVSDNFFVHWWFWWRVSFCFISSFIVFAFFWWKVDGKFIKRWVFASILISLVLALRSS